MNRILPFLLLAAAAGFDHAAPAVIALWPEGVPGVRPGLGPEREDRGGIGNVSEPTLILCAPVPHRDQWENGRDFASFASWDDEVARAGGALNMDLTMLVSDACRKTGADQVNTFFFDARTHTNDAGAQFNAARVADGLKGLKGNPFGAYFSRVTP
jgi:hypothetical protein